MIGPQAPLDHAGDACGEPLPPPARQRMLAGDLGRVDGIEISLSLAEVGVEEVASLPDRLLVRLGVWRLRRADLVCRRAQVAPKARTGCCDCERWIDEEHDALRR